MTPRVGESVKREEKTKVINQLSICIPANGSICQAQDPRYLPGMGSKL